MTPATLDVLDVLLGLDEELYGLRIAKAIGRPTGSIYPILARLERMGWVDSEWELTDSASRGPRRRFYRLSPTGLTAARAAVKGRRKPARSGLPQPCPGPALGFRSAQGWPR